jgi:hypothetical protein
MRKRVIRIEENSRPGSGRRQMDGARRSKEEEKRPKEGGERTKGFSK